MAEAKVVRHRASAYGPVLPRCSSGYDTARRPLFLRRCAFRGDLTFVSVATIRLSLFRSFIALNVTADPTTIAMTPAALTKEN
jgi:hypothetical protein